MSILLSVTINLGKTSNLYDETTDAQDLIRIKVGLVNLHNYADSVKFDNVELIYVNAISFQLNSVIMKKIKRITNI